MIRITTILLLIMVLGCDIQEPDYCLEKDILLSDTIEYFEGYTDSLNLVIYNLELAIESGQVIYFADSFNYEFRGLTDLMTINIRKQSENIRIDVVDKDIDRRFHFYYRDKERFIQTGDSLKGSPLISLE